MASTSGKRTRATNEDLQVSTQLRDVTSRLVKSFGDGTGDGENRIRRTVATIEARFGDARVRTFLPILIERAARAELGRDPMPAARATPPMGQMEETPRGVPLRVP